MRKKIDRPHYRENRPIDIDEQYAFGVIETALALIFRPPPTLKPSEWAEKHRVLSAESNARGGGKWRNLPMQVQPMDDTIDPNVQSICLMWAAQTAGKTELLLNIFGYFAEQQPAPMLMVQPTLDMAEDYGTDRINPMIRDTEVLRDLFDISGKLRTLHKSFPGGYLKLAGANSPSSLSSRPVRITLFDEIDRFPDSAGKEGDPLDLAEKRSDTFPDAFSVLTSTPTISGHSKIEKRFETSDKNYWFCPCPTCGHLQYLKWKQLKFDPDCPESLESTYYECESDQKCHWTDEMRVGAIMAGGWKATAPFKGTRGYHLSGLYSLFRRKRGFKNRLHQFVVQFLSAKRKGKDSLKVWVNTFLAETWSEAEDAKPDWKKVFERREQINPLGPWPLNDRIPNGVQIITAGTDFQADRIEVSFVGYGPGEESWMLGHKVIYGDVRNPEIYQRLDGLLLQQFTREDGAVLQMNAAGFDTGYAASQRQLYAWLKLRAGRRYFAFKGHNIKIAEPISHSAKSKVDRVNLIMVGTNRIKSYIYNRLTISKPGAPGYIHIPANAEYNEEWCKQLLAEESETEIINGAKYRIFYMPEVIADGGTDRNEALDCTVYALAALYARGIPSWRVIENRNKETISAEGEMVIMPVAETPETVTVVETLVRQVLPKNIFNRRKKRANLLSDIFTGGM
jgi:phage terminase large subunit GpA-like protein